MTMPCERTRAVQYTREFLLRLCNPKETPRVPKEVRREASRLLKHYPGTFYLGEAAKNSPDVFGPALPTEYERKQEEERARWHKEYYERLRAKAKRRGER